MSDIFVIFTLIFSMIFEISIVVGRVLNSINVNAVRAELDSNTAAYTQLSNALVYNNIQIVVCCVLILLSVTACVVLFRRKSKNN